MLAMMILLHVLRNTLHLQIIAFCFYYFFYVMIYFMVGTTDLVLTDG